jgi:hypothetical protein
MTKMHGEVVSRYREKVKNMVKFIKVKGGEEEGKK